MYALNLGADGRVLSATYPQFAPQGAVIVEALLEGNVGDYLYADGAFTYSPLESAQEELTDAQRIARLEEQSDILTACLLEMSEIVYA